HHIAVCFELEFRSAPHDSVREKACDPYTEMQRVAEWHQPPLFSDSFVVHSPHTHRPSQSQPQQEIRGEGKYGSLGRSGCSGTEQRPEESVRDKEPHVRSRPAQANCSSPAQLV